jgi:hypothetical protein
MVITKDYRNETFIFDIVILLISMISSLKACVTCSFLERYICTYIEIGILTEIAYLDQNMLHSETYAIEHR